MPTLDHHQPSGDQLVATWVDLIVRLGVLGILLYWSFLILQPFITIAIWSVVLTVALYPLYDWIVALSGGRRRLAAAVLTIVNLLIVIGPATWLVLGLIDSLRTVSERLDLSALALPPPPDTIRGWPLVGEPLYQFWELASTNLSEAFAKVAPHPETVWRLGDSHRRGSRHRGPPVLHRHHGRGISFFARAHADRCG